MLPKMNIMLEQFTVIDYSKIHYLFHTYLNYLPPYERLPVMKDHIRKLMKDTFACVSEKLEIQCNNTVLTLKREQKDSPERQALIIRPSSIGNTLLYRRESQKLWIILRRNQKRFPKYYMDFLAIPWKSKGILRKSRRNLFFYQPGWLN